MFRFFSIVQKHEPSIVLTAVANRASAQNPSLCVWRHVVFINCTFFFTPVCVYFLCNFLTVHVFSFVLESLEKAIRTAFRHRRINANVKYDRACREKKGSVDGRKKKERGKKESTSFTIESELSYARAIWWEIACNICHCRDGIVLRDRKRESPGNMWGNS